MADYGNFISLANRLIAKKGIAMTYVHVTESGAIDPVTGKRQVAEEAIEFMGVKVSPSATELQAGHFAGVDMVILAPGDAIAKADLTDRIICQGHDCRIREIIRIMPAEVCVLYKFGVKDMGPCLT